MKIKGFVFWVIPIADDPEEVHYQHAQTGACVMVEPLLPEAVVEKIMGRYAFYSQKNAVFGRHAWSITRLLRPLSTVRDIARHFSLGSLRSAVRRDGFVRFCTKVLVETYFVIWALGVIAHSGGKNVLGNLARRAGF